MGTITSRDTRRISFDNTFAVNSALAVQSSMEDDNVIVMENLESLTKDTRDCKEISRFDFAEESETDYWARRIDHLKKEHQLINKIYETEYEKTIERTKDIYETPKVTHERIQKIKPCFEWRSKILQCYEANPHQPLVCSGVVQAFSNCVKSCRLED